MTGMGRDILTRAAGGPAQIVAEDTLHLTMGAERRIAEISASRRSDIVRGAAGLRGGGDLRALVAERLADEQADVSLLFRLLDDLGGAAFMAVSAWHAWEPGGSDVYAAHGGRPSVIGRPVEGLCLSYKPGSESIAADGSANEAVIEQLDAPAPFADHDPQAWHDFAGENGPNHWRLRRTDAWHSPDGMLCLDGWFQDSAALPDEPVRRKIFHEYRLTAVIHPADMTVADLQVTAQVLPFRTCLAAPDTARMLIGQPLARLRDVVPVMMAGTAGCTHLNDMYRALYDGIALARILGGNAAYGAGQDAATGS